MVSYGFDYLAQISTPCFIIYNKMIASIVSCNITSIKWIQSIRSSHLNYILSTQYSLTVSFMIAYTNVLFIIGINLTDINSYV